jgi:hypothetical protein
VSSAWRFEAVSDIRADAITGTSERDIWFVSDAGLYRYDGATTERVDGGFCKPTSSAAQQMSVSAMYVDDKTITLYGSVESPYEGDSGGIRALATRARAGGKWRCRSEGPSFSVRSIGACGNSFWQLSYVYQGILRWGQKAIRGPAVPGNSDTAFWRSCTGPAWIAVNLDSNTACPEVWEWNAGRWKSLGAPPDIVKALWGIDPGSLLGIGMKNWSNHDLHGESDTVLRYEHGQWSRLETPQGFTAYSIEAVSREEVWFFGKGQATRFTPNGFELRALPFDYVSATWVSPTSTLWIAGDGGVGRIR